MTTTACLENMNKMSTVQIDNGRIPVRLPELFALFLSQQPKLNPHYGSVKRPAVEWISKWCSFDARMSRIISRTDFAYFISITVPEAGPEELRACFDWGNWVFPFDDMFDNGHLKNDLVSSQEMIDRLLFRLQPGRENQFASGDPPLIQVVNSVWDKIVQKSPSGVQRRYAKAMTDYARGVLDQVGVVSLHQHPTLEEVLDMRRESAGVSPLFALVEYAHGLEIPDQVFECASIKEIERIGVDFVVLSVVSKVYSSGVLTNVLTRQNDMLSYCKEEKDGVGHNMVAVCRNAGMSAQAAYDHMGDLLKQRYRDWYLALAALPSWGREIDSQVQRYIEGVQRVVQANLHWSFKSSRYFGNEVDEVLKTMTIYVYPQQADIVQTIDTPFQRGNL